MNRTVFALALVVVVGCSSSDPYERRPQRMNRPALSQASDLDVVPPPSWWRNYAIAEPLDLSNEQMQQLDRVASEFGEQDIRQLQRDTLTAVRDLRAVLDSDKPSSDDIVAAGQRVRSLRGEISDRQLKLLAAERQILTRDQWQKLQDQLREERMPRDRMTDYPRRGRGGFGGRGPGRRPGY
jgi:Spy/CpxP family protein refolding chaperone